MYISKKFCSRNKFGEHILINLLIMLANYKSSEHLMCANKMVSELLLILSSIIKSNLELFPFFMVRLMIIFNLAGKENLKGTLYLLAPKLK